MECPDCGFEMGDSIDTTYSNTGKGFKSVIPCGPNHTGDIFFCERCECKWVHDFIRDTVTRWLG